jgi:diguanylate cyclase (GGDEF)-like protein/PAS domain S-box-containing protein
MSHPPPQRAQTAIGATLLAASLPVLWWSSQGGATLAPPHFIFWHTLVECATVVVAMLVFITGHRAILAAGQGAVVLLGIGFFGVGVFDLLHLLSYAGMPDAYSPNTPHKSMAFWLAARLLAAATLLAYTSGVRRITVTPPRKRQLMLAMLAGVLLVAVAGLLYPQLLPPLFVPGQGLTRWKLGAEWTVIALSVLALYFLWRNRDAWDAASSRALGFALALTCASELFFTQLGALDQNAANALGHLYKLGAYLYLLHATFDLALRRPLLQLQLQHQREKVALDAAPDGVLWVAEDGTITLANPAMVQLSGYAPHELVGQNIALLLPEAARERHGQAVQAFFAQPRARAMGSQDLTLRRRDASLLPVDISLGHWQDAGRHHAIAYIRNLAERRRFEESLRHQATHDNLTGLPNRWLFQLTLRQALARAERRTSRLAVLFLDLDYFKTINDSFGHDTGDKLLQRVAERMRATLRDGDMLCRLGGDEFAILLTEIESVDDAVQVAQKVLAEVRTPFVVDAHDIHTGASIGIALAPHDASDPDTLLRYADLAMYQAKHAGRGVYACYSAELDRKAHEDLQILMRLKEAIAQDTLSLHFQPQVDVRTGQTLGMEALLRWDDPVLGAVAPQRCVAVAESMGQMAALADWVIRSAARQIAAWSQQGHPMRVAVNISTQQFREGDLHTRVSHALQEAGAPPHLLEIEVTETAAMSQPAQARQQLSALVVQGCKVSLDDFGTGYSSLEYLKHLPVSQLKIDRKFVAGLPLDEDDATICKTIVALAHNLQMSVVAEGVETPQQLAFLQSIGCGACQGWLFAPALPARQALAWALARRQQEPAQPAGAPASGA